MDDEENDNHNKKRIKLNPDGDRDDMSVDDPLVSIVQALRPSDEDIVASLYPLLLQFPPYDSTPSLISKLSEIRILQVSNLARGKHPDAILKNLWTIYQEARKTEMNIKIQRSGQGIFPKHLITAFELRNAILNSELKDIGVGGKMKVYNRVVPDLQNPGDYQQVVLRDADEDFWKTCLSCSKENHPVCGVGIPGIGKTTTTLYLLQNIIRREKKPVVFTIRCASSKEGIYYELSPLFQEGQEVHDIKVILHMKTHQDMLRYGTLQNENAFYVVDSGKFKESCDDTDQIEARFIMAASNDRTLWGENEFEKNRQPNLRGTVLQQTVRPNQRSGLFVYGQLWTASQVLAAKPYLAALEDKEDREILRRYRMFGGSIRDIIAMEEGQFQSNALSALATITINIVNELLDGRYAFSFKPDEPSSKLIGIGPTQDDPTDYTVFLKSDYIQELLAEKFLRNSWYAVLNEDNGSNRGNLFEVFVRRMFYKNPVHFESDQIRESLREKSSDPRFKSRNYQAVDVGMTVGSEREVRRVSNLVESVRNDSKKEFLFYSKNESEPLIDMIYRVDGGYEAIQATISKKHDAARDKIENLKNGLDLQSDQTLRIFYAVPSVRYNEFATTPANPLDTDVYDFSNISIYHLSIDGVREEP